MTSSNIVAKVWNYCNILKDDGVSYLDYIEQLTYLIFLKMADEYGKPPHNRPAIIEEGLDWESLKDKTGKELETHYNLVLNELGGKSGMLGEIFFKAQNKIQDPSKLARLVNLIDEETWTMMETDVKGDIYEGLLQKNAEDVKSGSGQYFTPRELIKAIVEVVRPRPMKSIADPACGTGGFFLASYNYLKELGLDSEEKKFLKDETFHGWEIVPSAARLCLMNLYLHNIGDIDKEPPVSREDSLLSKPKRNYDYVLTNPPFGKKSSFTVTNGNGTQKKESLTYERSEFWKTTSNKQLNFVQHIYSMLKADGKAAVVVPDNVLFEGGAGETVRKKLLRVTDLHTILRLPTGIFYAQGVKANVIFFDNKGSSADPWTKDIWIYDLRTNKHFTLKTRKMEYSDLEDFIKCYNPENRHKRKETERFRKFSYSEIIKRDKTNLDIFWLKDESLGNTDNLPEPDIIAKEIIDNMEAGLKNFRNVLNECRKDKRDSI